MPSLESQKTSVLEMAHEKIIELLRKHRQDRRALVPPKASKKSTGGTSRGPRTARAKKKTVDINKISARQAAAILAQLKNKGISDGD